jgi:UDP-arabinose 4-epimerase
MTARAPQSLYGQTKLAGERLLAEYRAGHGLRTLALRLFNAAGADPDGSSGEDHTPETHLLPLAIAAALGQRPALEIYGNDYPTEDGTAVRDYIHVCDIADAFLHGAQYLKEGGAAATLNLGSGVATSVRALITRLERLSGTPVPAVEMPRRSGDAPWLVADTALVRSTLRWQPRYSLDRIIETALRWQRAKPE